MNMKQYFVIISCLITASYSLAVVPVTVEVLEVKKIWDQAPHNAFTDLVRWHDAFYCAFREGRGHVSTDGRIRILESKDADVWTSAALISLEGYDLRDAHLSVTPDGWLMLLGGAAPRKKDNQSAPTGTFVSFSKDGRQWSEPQIAVQPGRWLWCVTWHKGKAYGVSYTAGKGDRYLDLLVSDDGINYKPHVQRLFEQGYPNEVTLRFHSDGTCYALVRRDRRGDDPSSALLGISRPDYKQWQWKDLGSEFNGFGGPNFIQIPGGHWLAAGRMHDGGAHTALCYLDVENGVVTKLTKLPSGGDTSYPGMVWHNGMLYVSYYSSHEGKTSIYLAKLKVLTNGSYTITGLILDPSMMDNDVGQEKDPEAVTKKSNPPIDKEDPIDRTVIGQVVDPNGLPLARIPIVTYGYHKRETMTEPDGRFAFKLPLNYYHEAGCLIVARDRQHNLAALQGYVGQDSSIVMKLEPAVVLEGKVCDSQGKGIKNAHFRLFWDFPKAGVAIGKWEDVTIDKKDQFEIRAVPYGRRYLIEITAQGYGIGEIDSINTDVKDVRIKLPPLVLQTANKSIGGIVIDPNGNPVANVKVRTGGKGQPWCQSMSDKHGRFLIKGICPGTVTLHGEHTYNQVLISGRINVQAGDMDVSLILNEHRQLETHSKLNFESLVGKALPSLENLNLRFDLDQVRDKMILICFWDMNQRPSRNCITQLAKQSERLKEKDLIIIAVHASNVDENDLNEWVKKNSIPFPVGMIQDEEEKTRFSWGVKSLPWLILTNREHIVTAEGFGLNELDDKIKQTGDGK